MAMRFWYQIFVALAAASTVVFFTLTGFALRDFQAREVPREVSAGKKIWQDNGCVECHTIFGNGGYNAPDLTKTYEARGRKWLVDFFNNPPDLGRAKPHPTVGEGDTQMLLLYLKYLAETPISPGWPPEPLIKEP